VYSSFNSIDIHLVLLNMEALKHKGGGVYKTVIVHKTRFKVGWNARLQTCGGRE